MYVAAAGIRAFNVTTGPLIWPPSPSNVSANIKFCAFKEWMHQDCYQEEVGLHTALRVPGA